MLADAGSWLFSGVVQPVEGQRGSVSMAIFLICEGGNVNLLSNRTT